MFKVIQFMSIFPLGVMVKIICGQSHSLELKNVIYQNEICTKLINHENVAKVMRIVSI